MPWILRHPERGRTLYVASAADGTIMSRTHAAGLRNETFGVGTWSTRRSSYRMGRRREPRAQMQVPVRIFGTDCSGQVFSANAVTVNVSRQGAELSGVQTSLKIDDTIGLSLGNKRGRFRVKWIGEAGTPTAGHMGLVTLTPEVVLWDVSLPPAAPDNFQPRMVDQRKHARFKCCNPIELQTRDGASFRATTADLSVGGCYVEMAMPMQQGAKLKAGLWIGEAKCSVDCQVAYTAPGLGIGLRFIRISEPDLERIRQFLGTLAPFAKKTNVRE